jgi:hypothetical protein
MYGFTANPNNLQFADLLLREPNSLLDDSTGLVPDTLNGGEAGLDESCNVIGSDTMKVLHTKLDARVSAGKVTADEVIYT